MSFPSLDLYPSLTESDVFASNYETLGPDYFDEYLALNASTKEKNSSSVLSDPNFFRRISGHSGSAGTSSSSLEDDTKPFIQRDDVDNEPWTPNPTPLQGHSIYPESSGTLAMSEREILNLEGITLNSPHTPTRFQPYFSQSPYDTATFLRRPSGLTDTPSKSLRNTCANGFRNPIRKASSFPKMMRTLHNSNPDFWVAHPESSKLGLNFHSHANPMSSSISSRGFSTPEYPTTEGTGDNALYLNGINQSFVAGAFDFETALSTPVSDVRSVRRVRSEHQVPDNSMLSLKSELDYASREWSPIPSSSGLHENDIPSLYSPEQDSPLWWSHAASAPMAQPFPTSLHVNPKRATESVAVQLHNKVSPTFDGLPYRLSYMASVSGSDGISSQFFAMEPSMGEQYSSTQSQPQYLAQLKHQQQNATDTESKQPRLVRKPRFGPEELDLVPPSPSPSPELQVRKRKTSTKQPKPPTQRMPSLGSGVPGTSASAAPSVGFVNYTPNDSQKILTGVAPSGSSKTKARREKEALDKRRKLSQAAVRAVRAVGGDVTALAEEGLLV